MTHKPKQLGHVNLYVRDVERSEAFYVGILGLHTYERCPGRSVFMSADLDQSHEVAVMQLGPDAAGPAQKQVGLNHIAWRMDTFEDLRELYHRLQARGVEIDRVMDHGISMGVYFRDPDGNGNEVYYELPRDQWPQGDELFTDKFPMSLEEEAASSNTGRAS